MKRFFSFFLVLMQFFCIFFLIFKSQVPFQNLFSSIFIFLGLFIGFYALYSFRVTKFSFFPQLRPGSKWVSDGIYKYLRHPMYLGVLLFSFGFFFSSVNAINAGILFVLFLVLYAKIIIEEQQLVMVFPDYINYLKSSKRLIPFVW